MTARNLFNRAPDPRGPRPRVLLIAEAANPEWASVPLVGWSHSQALAQVADTHLVTQVRNRDALRRAGLVEGPDFTAIDSEAVAAGVYRAAVFLRGGASQSWTTATALASLAYYHFERLLWRQFGARLRRGEFHLVHRLTPLSPTTPSLLAGWCRRAGVPFVLGPLNGGVPWPAGFGAQRRREREWLSPVRGLHRLLPGYRGTRRAAAALLVGSRATWEQMPRRYRDKCIYLPENAIDPRRFPPRPVPEARLPLRVVFLGRLVPYKGADLLLEAAAPLIRAGVLKVDVIGAGPDLPLVRGLIAGAGLGAGVRLLGWIEHEQLRHHLAQAHVLGFPSIREFGGGVVLEAMALGLVPVVVNYGGPGELVTPSTGFRVPMGSRSDLIAGFRAALARLVDHPELVRPLGAAAQQRVLEHFTWEAKAHQVLRVYQWVLGQSPHKPDFGFLRAQAPEPALDAPA